MSVSLLEKSVRMVISYSFKVYLTKTENMRKESAHHHPFSESARRMWGDTLVSVMSPGPHHLQTETPRGFGLLIHEIGMMPNLDVVIAKAKQSVWCRRGIVAL